MGWPVLYVFKWNIASACEAELSLKVETLNRILFHEIYLIGGPGTIVTLLTILLLFLILFRHLLIRQRVVKYCI